MYGNAVVVGKFLPPHSGHIALIRKATEVANHVDVLLVVAPSDAYLPMQRALAIYEEFSHVDLRVHIIDNIDADADTPENNRLWADYTETILGYSPDVVVASEEYVYGWARAMNANAFLFDKERVEFPASGTLCRANAYSMKDYLPDSTARFMQPRIVVLGAESTGTTTLSKQLAEYYNTVMVPEYGRMIGENVVRRGEAITPEEQDAWWNDARFSLCAHGQDAMEERLAREANGVLICDTDSLATAIWYEYAMKKEYSGVSGKPQAIIDHMRTGREIAKKHSLYIVTGDEIPFEQDEYGSRTGEDLREWMTDRFIELLTTLALPFIIVTGDREARFKAAVAAVDKVISQYPGL